MLLVLTGLALALACVNVASLLVVRSAGREKEIGLALGAGRATLIRQFLTETLVLAAIGGAAGLLVAPWAAGLLVATQPDVLDIDTHVDMRVFLFGLSAAVLTASSPAGARAHIEQNPDRAGLRAAGRCARHAPAPDTAP